MSELFGYDDLTAVLARTNLMPSDVKELLLAWGINASDLFRFLREGAAEGREEYTGQPGADSYASAMLVGFALGFQVAQELRMREEVKSNDNDEDD